MSRLFLEDAINLAGKVTQNEKLYNEIKNLI